MEKKTKIEKLPELLVTPERFGRVALNNVLEVNFGSYRLPETARVYEFPTPPEAS